MITVGSLFSGIGGIDLGLERAGMKVLWQVEKDPYAQQVLKKHWPKVKLYDDVTRVHGHNHEHNAAVRCSACVAPVDLLCGGFPCQDISVAGKGKGIKGERSGLWKEFARLIQELKPRWVLIENVPALRSRGLETVLQDLSAGGYDAEWDGVSAAAVGAPHLRDRIFIVAYLKREQLRVESGRRSGAQGQDPAQFADNGRARDVANANSDGRGGRGKVRGRKPDPSGSGEALDIKLGTSPQGILRLASEVIHETLTNAESIGRSEGGDQAQCYNSEARVFRLCQSPGGDAGIRTSQWWATEPRLDRMAHGVPARVDRIRCLGNAVVPQVAEAVGRLIVQASHEQ